MTYFAFFVILLVEIFFEILLQETFLTQNNLKVIFHRD